MHKKLHYSLLSRCGRGFTLIELLVAVGITALLVALMLNVVVSVLSSWNRSSGTLSSNGQAATVLNQIASDLQGAITRRDGNVWIAVTIQNNQTGTGDAQMSTASWTATNMKPTATSGSLTLNPATRLIQDCRFGQAGVWLRFFTTPPDDNSSVTNISAPRAVAYQIIRRKSQATATEVPYQLFRSEARPGSATSSDSTFAVGYNLYMPTATNPGYNAGNATQANTGNIRRPNANQLIANNVIDFGVKFFANYNSGTNTAMTEIFPVDRRPGGAATPYGGFAATTDTTKTPPEGVPAAGPVLYAFPEEAEIMVRILTDEGARLIQNLENPPTGYTPVPPAGLSMDQYWWQLAIQNSHVYTRHIQIKSQAF